METLIILITLSTEFKTLFQLKYLKWKIIFLTLINFVKRKHTKSTLWEQGITRLLK